MANAGLSRDEINIWGQNGPTQIMKNRYDLLLDLMQKKYEKSVIKKGNMIFNQYKPPELQIQNVLPPPLIHQQRMNSVSRNNYYSFETAFGTTGRGPAGTYDRQIQPDNNSRVVYQAPTR